MSNDCRTKCRNCNHYVDLVAGECPLCDEVYYKEDDEEVIDTKVNITISFTTPTEGQWVEICKELKALIPKQMTAERFNFLYMQQPVADKDKF
jgi:hypothetical protein